MTDHLKMLTEASNTVWRVFKASYSDGKDYGNVFDQLEQKYAATGCKSYVQDYIEMCKLELRKAKTDDYIPMAQKATGEMWKLFKKYFQKISDNNMSDYDWANVSDMTSKVGEEYRRTPIWIYAMNYAVICVHELDRIDRRIRGISDQMTLQEYMTGGN